MQEISNIVQKFIMALSVLFLSSCVEEYLPDLGSKYDRVLVVDGKLTDQPGLHTITLSLSTKVYRPFFEPLSGASVSIIDEQGQEEIFVEVEEGVYQNEDESFSGMVGRSYQLKIMTADNKSYQSDFEVLPLSTGIDTVYARTEYQFDDNYGFDLPGYQFYISTDYAESDTCFYIWQMQSTFKYHANYTLKYIFNGSYRVANNFDSVYYCWGTENVKGIYAYSTENISEPVIKDYPLQFVSTDSKRISDRYSMLVRQYSVSRKTFEFWNSIGAIESNQGSLYTRQPYQLKGNVENIDDPEEPVLGYFIVGGVTEKRIYVDRPMGVNFYYDPDCALITEDLYRYLLFLRSQWPLLLTAIPTESGQYPALPADQSCIDCLKEFSGASYKPPDFWIDY